MATRKLKVLKVTPGRIVGGKFVANPKDASQYQAVVYHHGYREGSSLFTSAVDARKWAKRRIDELKRKAKDKTGYSTSITKMPRSTSQFPTAQSKKDIKRLIHGDYFKESKRISRRERGKRK